MTTNTARSVALSGCFDCREILKSHGGTFDATSKSWTLTEEQFNAADAEIDGLRDSKSKSKVAIVKAWDKAEGRWFTPVTTDATTIPSPKDDVAEKLQKIAHGVLSVDDAMNSDD